MSSIIIRPSEGAVIKNGLLNGNGLIINYTDRVIKLGEMLQNKLNGANCCYATWTINPFVLTVRQGVFAQGIPIDVQIFTSGELNTTATGIHQITLSTNDNVLLLDIEFINGKLNNLKISA